MKLTREQFATLRQMGVPKDPDPAIVMLMDKYAEDDRFTYRRVGERISLAHPELGEIYLKPTDRLAQLLDGGN